MDQEPKPTYTVLTPGEDMALGFLLNARAAAIQAAERSFSEGVQQVFGHLVGDKKVLGFEKVNDRSYLLKLHESPPPAPTQGE